MTQEQVNRIDETKNESKPLGIGQCSYVLAWIGECGKPADESGFCEEHNGLKCPCGNQAKYECSATFQFVCGCPMCGDDCKHSHSK